MSISGISYLNKIVKQNAIYESNKILNELRVKIKYARHSSKDDLSKNGMDIALCVIDKQTNVLQYPGAYNPIYVIRNNELIVLKGDRMPIGSYIKKEKAFSSQDFNLQKEDMLFMFSDGYTDQFGGDNGYKFKLNNFRQMLFDISQFPPDGQRSKLDNTLKDRKDERYSQIDDILVLGVKV